MQFLHKRKTFSYFFLWELQEKDYIRKVLLCTNYKCCPKVLKLSGGKNLELIILIE